MADRRFESTFFTEPTDDPGLVLGPDGVVYLVKPDGSRVAVGSGGSLPPQWTIDAFGNLLIESGGPGNFDAEGISSDISGIAIKVDAAGSDVFWVNHPVFGDGVFQLSVDGGLVATQLDIEALEGALALRITAGDATAINLVHTTDGNGGHPLEILNNGKIGFFSATPVDKPTGVAVSAAGIHAALVSLGLIAA